MVTAGRVKRFPTPTPDDAIAGLGLGLAFSAFEAWRYPSISSTGESDSFLSTGFTLGSAAILCLVVCMVFCLVSKERLLKKPFVMVLVSIAASLTLLFYSSLYSQDSIPDPVFFFAKFHMLFGVLFVVLWFDELLHIERDSALNVMTIGLLSTFLFQTSIVLLNESIVFGICSLMPIVSALFFMLHRQYSKERIEYPLEDGASRTQEQTVLGALKRIGVFVPGCFALLCCGMLFNLLNHTWRTGEVTVFGSVEIQVFSAAGALLAGLVLLFLSKPVGRGVIEVFLVVFSLVALLMSSSSELSSAVFLVPLNAAQKLTFVIMLLAGQRMNNPRIGLAAVCALFASYRIGLGSLRYLQDVLANVPFPQTSAVVDNELVAFGAIVLLAYAAVELIHIHDRTTELRAAAAVPRSEVDQEVAERYKQAAFSYFLMQRFGLTQREVEIIVLAEKGMNAKSIADELVISQSTAKSHLRNIYSKVGLHSRAEVIDVMKEQREYFFHI